MERQWFYMSIYSPFSSKIFCCSEPSQQTIISNKHFDRPSMVVDIFKGTTFVIKDDEVDQLSLFSYNTRIINTYIWKNELRFK